MPRQPAFFLKIFHKNKYNIIRRRKNMSRKAEKMFLCRKVEQLRCRKERGLNRRIARYVKNKISKKSINFINLIVDI